MELTDKEKLARLTRFVENLNEALPRLDNAALIYAKQGYDNGYYGPADVTANDQLFYQLGWVDMLAKQMKEVAEAKRYRKPRAK